MNLAARARWGVGGHDSVPHGWWHRASITGTAQPCTAAFKTDPGEVPYCHLKRYKAGIDLKSQEKPHSNPSSLPPTAGIQMISSVVIFPHDMAWWMSFGMALNPQTRQYRGMSQRGSCRWWGWESSAKARRLVLLLRLCFLLQDLTEHHESAEE